MKRPEKTTPATKSAVPASPEILAEMIRSLDLCNKRISAIEQMMKMRSALESMGILEEMEALSALSIADLYKRATAIKEEQRTIEERRIKMLKDLGL